MFKPSKGSLLLGEPNLRTRRVSVFDFNGSVEKGVHAISHDRAIRPITKPINQKRRKSSMGSSLANYHHSW